MNRIPQVVTKATLSSHMGPVDVCRHDLADGTSQARLVGPNGEVVYVVGSIGGRPGSVMLTMPGVFTMPILLPQRFGHRFDLGWLQRYINGSIT